MGHNENSICSNDLKLFFKSSVFRKMFAETSIKLKHLIIGIRELKGYNIWFSFITILTIEGVAFLVASGFLV